MTFARALLAAICLGIAILPESLYNIAEAFGQGATVVGLIALGLAVTLAGLPGSGAEDA